MPFVSNSTISILLEISVLLPSFVNFEDEVLRSIKIHKFSSKAPFVDGGPSNFSTSLLLDLLIISFSFLISSALTP